MTPVNGVSSSSSEALTNGDSAGSNDLPHLRRTGPFSEVFVKGKPFLILGAELQNSSLSSAKYMRSVWPKLVATNVNTVLGSVSWDDIEPVEGQFDFTELDQVIKDAGSHGLHLVLLWFGSYKNGKSTYVPSWVKRDAKRFPRARSREAGGTVQTVEVLSPFSAETIRADATAFAALMKHLAAVNHDFTVIMVQVENEVGMLGDSRDASPGANKAFAAQVPADLVSFLSKSFNGLHPTLQENLKSFHACPIQNASWTETFGASKQTDELFMAYQYANFVNTVAAAGKPYHPVPLFTNVWMNYVGKNNAFPGIAGGGGNPGDYPSGGSVPNTIDIWHQYAPNLDFIAPDIYLNDYVEVCGNYRHHGQPLFIPEQRRDDFGARRVWSAIGTHHAIGISPFGIDTLDPATNPFTKTYGLLASMAPTILKYRHRADSSIGFFFDEVADNPYDEPGPWIRRFGDLELTIDRSFVFGKAKPGAGMIIYLGGASFLFIGWGFRVTFKSLKPSATFTGTLRFEEKEVVDASTGKLRTLRKLNGDETRSGAFVNMPDEDPDYGGFPIAVTIPSNTMIAEVEAYTLEEDDL